MFFSENHRDAGDVHDSPDSGRVCGGGGGGAAAVRHVPHLRGWRQQADGGGDCG